MAMTLPYDEWIAAKGELEALQRRVDMTNLRHLQPMLWRVHRTLAIDCAPKVAAAELKWVAEGMKAYPWLRKISNRSCQPDLRFSTRRQRPARVVAPEPLIAS